jgi:ABC-2 type transport system ATP-binding protein
VKRRFGRNTVILDHEDGNGLFLGDIVKRENRFASYVELTLNDGVDPQEVVRRAIGAGARINRFELVEPSLNEIFIESVTKRGDPQ